MSTVQEKLTSIQAQLTELQNQLGGKVKNVTENMTENQKKGALGVGAAVGAYSLYRVVKGLSGWMSRRRRLALIEEMKQDGKLHVFMFPRSPWAPSVSGPCSKLEAFLRLAGIEYEAHISMDTYGSPNDCVPFIVHGDLVLADSGRIIQYLTTEYHVGVDYKLNKSDRALGTALVNMLEYSIVPTYYRIVFVDKPQLGAAVISRALGIPTVFARLGIRPFSKELRSSLKLTTAGSLTQEQYENEFLRDCEAIEQQIGDKPFLFGDEPTTYDCHVYAVFIPFVNMKSYAEVSEAFLAVSQSPVLVDYLARLTDRLFPDLDEILAHTAVAQSEIAESMAGDEEGEEDEEEESLHAVERDDAEEAAPEKVEEAAQEEDAPRAAEEEEVAVPDVEETVAGDEEHEDEEREL